MRRIALHTGLMLLACTGGALAMEAPAGETLNLSNLSAAEQVIAASWIKEPAGYRVQILLRQAPVPTPAPPSSRSTMEAWERPIASPDIVDERSRRASAFIGNTIANLRDLKPTYCGRQLSLNNQSANVPGVEIWLLKANGAHVVPTDRACRFEATTDGSRPTLDISYSFRPEDGQQAVAVAVRVYDSFYIEKLSAE